MDQPQEISFRQKMRYRFDNMMAKGTPAMIAGLALLSLAVIIIISLIAMIVSRVGDNSSFADDGPVTVFFKTMLRTLDPGTMGGDEGAAPFLLTMLVATLAGLFLVSTLIGILSSGIESKIEELRKGRSLVLETGHTLILGWSDQVFTIIRELKTANESEAKSCIVVLADKDKVEMEDEIRQKVGNTGKMRVVCRTGSPLDLDDLNIANPQNAKSIIVLSPTDDDPNSQVIKTVLALTNSSRRRKGEYHIVAVIRDPKNLEAAHLVGGKDAQYIESGDTIARLIAQACRQSGLSVVYTELLDFGGDEIYMKAEPALVGKTFGDALSAYDKCTVIGIHSAVDGVLVNPSMDRPIQEGDELIVIAEDDSAIKVSGTPGNIVVDAIRTATPIPSEPERILIMGWNDHAAAIINELDNYVAPGSVVTVIASAEHGQEQIERECVACKNIEIKYQDGDTTDRRTIDALNPHEYEHIVVLCYSDTLDPQRADARTLITLLHLRDIEQKMGERFSIVSEMLDDRNRELAEVTEADDFIVSDKLLSLILSQISENKQLSAVFQDLFDPEGSEIYVKSAVDYVAPGKPVNFYTVVESARKRGHCAIGYISSSANGSHKTSVKVNPDKNATITFAEADRIVVLAED